MAIAIAPTTVEIMAIKRLENEHEKNMSRQDQLLIQAAMDIWCEQGGVHLSDLISDWNHENWTNFLRAMTQLHEVAESE